MSYNPTNWQNLPNTTSPVIASSLNNMETGISENDVAIGKEVYDNTQTYSVGDYCIYNNVLYRCKTAITTAESFDSSKWIATNVLSEIQKTQQFSTSATIVGKWINGKNLYRKVVSISITTLGVSGAVRLDDDVDEIVFYGGVFKERTYIRPLPYVYSRLTNNTVTELVSLYANNNVILVNVANFNDVQGWTLPITAYVTAYYTKTTD